MNGLPSVCVCTAVEDDLIELLRANCDLRIHANRISAYAGGLVRGEPSSSHDIARDLAASQGLLCANQMQITRELIAGAPRLRVISNVGVGFDHVDVDAATERGIAVCNTPGVLSDAVADYTMLMILELARGLVNYTSIVRDRRWSKGEAPPLGFDLAGKVLGIVGYGRIGRAVADRARVFGMRILTYDVKPDETDAERCVGLEVLLGEADIVSLHVDLSASTKRLIGERELRLMKPTAYLVNTARGGVVDQTALVAALRGGVIAGAALDVLEREPPAVDDPILALPNALILPHAASATRETRRAMRELAVRNLLSVLRGEPPECCVNPESLGRALRPS